MLRFVHPFRDSLHMNYSKLFLRPAFFKLGAVFVAASLLSSCASVLGPRQVELPLH